jgi:uncharacterized membrane-anchored protein
MRQSRPLRAPWLRWGLLALIQLGLIALPLAERFHVQRTGEYVRLALAPIDPRDLLRGDYIIINLAIGRLSADIPGAGTVAAGDKVFVGLAVKGSGPAEPAVIATNRDQAGALAIAGTVIDATGEAVRIDYGIDAFFVPEGEGLQIERLEPGRALLEIAVTRDGRSLPVSLIVDNQVVRSDATF